MLLDAAMYAFMSQLHFIVFTALYVACRRDGSVIRSKNQTYFMYIPLCSTLSIQRVCRSLARLSNIVVDTEGAVIVRL